MVSLNTYYIVWMTFLVRKVHVLDNGLAKTPPMGWMSWGYYMCADKCNTPSDPCLNESLIMSVADAFYTKGYQEAGYEYIIIDDCWSEHERDADGFLMPNKRRFPRGMKFLADYIHSRGLKFGMYTNIGQDTCMRYPGSRTFFEEDMKQFAKWEIDYLKVDGCFVEYDYLNTAYIDLGREINKTGRPIIYSCSWPFYLEIIHKRAFDYSKVMKTCNLWRNYHDVSFSVPWLSVKYIINHFRNNYEQLSKYHGPGHWNDPDMLVVGSPKMSINRIRVQMTVYCMMSAPLIISCPMDIITEEERSILQNMNLLAIAQDPLGIMAQPFKLGYLTLWVKIHMPVKGNLYHSFSFAIVNLENVPLTTSFIPAHYGLNYTDYTVLDVFKNEYIKNITMKDKMQVTVPAEDAVLYTMYAL